MKALMSNAREVSLRLILVLLIVQLAGVVQAADLTFEQQEAIWTDFSNWDKAIGVSSTAFQELLGDESTKEFLDDYGNAVLVINVSKELFHSGDLYAAMRIIKDKLQDKVIEKITPGFHSWLGWITWAKTGMELFKDIIFDPMVEQSQLDTYFGLREAGNEPLDAFAGVRGLGYIVERGKKEFRKQYGDLPFKAGSDELLPKWQQDFQRFIEAGLETKYQEKLHQEAIRKYQAAAALAEARLPELRAKLLLLLEQSRVETLDLDPASTVLHPGEQVAFTAIANYADPAAPRSSEDVTGDATWAGGTSDNVFTASDADVGKSFTITATYAGVTGTARVSVERTGCGDHGRWDDRAGRCVCDSGYAWNEDLGECIGEDEEVTGDAKEVLADMERQFYNAVEKFDEYYDDFIALLEAHGDASEDICSDTKVAYSFSRAAAAYALVDEYYFTALDLVGRGERGLNFDAIAVGNYESGIHVLDQIRLEMFRKDHQRIQGLGEGLPGKLAEYAPGCDPEDLLDAGARITDADQDTESGVDAPGTPTGGGGGGGGDGELRFERGGGLLSQEDLSASCSGGSLSLQVTEVSFPEVIYPTGTYTISVAFSWIAQGFEVDEVTMKAAVFWFSQLQESQEFTTLSGNKIVNFTVRGADGDFNLGAVGVSIVVGGGILCNNGSSDGVSGNYTQPFIRKGSSE